MTTHEAVARDIVRDVRSGKSQARAVKSCGRQGDLLVSRVGDAVGGGGPLALLTAAGVHGEHWLLTTQGRVEGDSIHLPIGALLVHTDKPEGRHGALELASGAWKCVKERELGAGEVVVQVKD